MTSKLPRVATPAEIKDAQLTISVCRNKRNTNPIKMIPHGEIGMVTALIEEWFSGERIEVIEIGRDDEGYMIFDVTVTYGQGAHTVGYLKSFNYKNFSERSIGEDIGIVRGAHAMRMYLKSALIKAQVIDANVEKTRALMEAQRNVPLMGWSVLSHADAITGSCKVCGRIDVTRGEDGRILLHDDNEGHGCSYRP